MSIHLISSILRRPWYIDRDFVEAHTPLIAQFIQRGYVPVPGTFPEERSKVPYSIKGAVIENGTTQGVRGSMEYGFNYDSAPEGSIAVIPVKGVLLKEDEDDGCGYFVAGTQTIARRIQEADRHHNIKGIILDVDSPGGTVDGVQALADGVAGTQKPVVAFVSGMAASAAYFIASSSKHIILENATISAGSIGVMISFMDTQPYYENLGIKFHDIVSTLSPDKNSNFYSALQGDYDPIKKELLDPFAKIFQDYVKGRRPNIDKTALTGKMYLAEDAVKLNLADAIGGIDLAIAKIDELAESAGPSAMHTQEPISISQSTNSKNLKMKNFPLLVALLAVDALESTDDGVFLNEDQLTAIEALLATSQQAETDLAAALKADADLKAAHQTALDALNRQLATAQDDLATARADVADRDTTIAELRKGPGEEPAGAVTPTDSLTDEGLDSLNETVAELSTNEAIAQLRSAGFKY